MTEAHTTESSPKEAYLLFFFAMFVSTYMFLWESFLKFSFNIFIFLSGGEIVFALYCGSLVISSFVLVLIKWQFKISTLNSVYAA